MNSLFIYFGITAGCAVTFIAYTVMMLIAKNKLSTKFIGIIASACVLFACMAYGEYNNYKAHGAFYDDAWKEKEVKSHFLFKSDDTEALQAIYDSDPGNFRYDLYNLILVRLGCEDCEEKEAQIRAAKAEIESKRQRPCYIVFTRSKIGQLYVSKYGIESVPVVIVDGYVIDLSSDNSDNIVQYEERYGKQQ